MSALHDSFGDMINEAMVRRELVAPPLADGCPVLLTGKSVTDVRRSDRWSEARIAYRVS